MASPLSNSLLVSSLLNLKAEDCRELAEQFFRQKDFEFAKTTILVAYRKNPDLPGLDLYLSAYLVHEIAFKTKNWYKILLIRDNSVGMDEIKKQYENLAWMVHPKRCSSVAAESALKLVNAAWEILSDPRRREAYDMVMEGFNHPWFNKLGF